MNSFQGEAIPSYSKQNYEARTTTACSRMLTGKGIPTVSKNHDRHLDTSPIGVQVGA